VFTRSLKASQKFAIEIDVSGYDVVKGRDNVYVIPNDQPLDLTGKIINSGKVGDK